MTEIFVKLLASYVMRWDMQQKGKRKEKKMTLRGIRTTHLLLSGQMSYPVRLEGHQNERLASECIITDANSYRTTPKFGRVRVRDRVPVPLKVIEIFFRTFLVRHYSVHFFRCM